MPGHDRDRAHDLDVREATPEDAVEIRDVHIAAIEGLAGSHYTAEQVAAWAHDRDPSAYPIAADDACVLVAERENRIVGMGRLAFTAGDHLQAAVDGEVVAVYVHPAVARTGVGTAIYRALEARARRSGLTTLGLWASRNAVAFYRAQGYERVTGHELTDDDSSRGDRDVDPRSRE